MFKFWNQRIGSRMPQKHNNQLRMSQTHTCLQQAAFRMNDHQENQPTHSCAPIARLKGTIAQCDHLKVAAGRKPWHFSPWSTASVRVNHTFPELVSSAGAIVKKSLNTKAGSRFMDLEYKLELPRCEKWKCHAYMRKCRRSQLD